MRLVAVVASLLISCFTFAFPEPLNDDAFLYIRTAEIFLRDGASAAFSHYSWASYSILIAAFSLTGMTLIQSAFFLNGLFFAVLTYAFMSVVKTVNSSSNVLAAAAVLILVFPELNEYRHFIIRDIGFWALVFAAIWQVTLFLQSNRLAHALAYFTSLLLAATLRLEAIVYLAFVPLVLLFFVKETLQLRRVKMLILGSIAGFVSICLALLASGVNVFALAAEFVSTYSPFLQNAFIPEPEQNREMSTMLFGSYGAVYSGYYLSVFMAAGFFALLLISIANAIGLPLLGILIVGLKTQFNSLRESNIKVLLATMLVNFTIVFGFIFVTRFLPSRYSMVLAISIAAIISVLVGQWFTANSKHSTPWQKYLPYLIVTYLFIDSYVSFGRSTSYIDEGIQWLAAEQLQQGQLITNTASIGYFSRAVEDYDQTSDDAFKEKVARAKPGDFIAVETHQSLTSFIEEQLESRQFEQLVAFPKDSTARLIIYRRVN